MSEQEPPALKEVSDILHDAVDQGLITIDQAQERIEAYRTGFMGRTVMKGSVEEKTG